MRKFALFSVIGLCAGFLLTYPRAQETNILGGGSGAPWAFGRNADLVYINGYRAGTPTNVSALTMSVGAPNTSRAWFTRAHITRTRQQGEINTVQWFQGVTTELDQFYIRLWYWNGTTYQCVGSTPDLVSYGLTANALNTVTFSPAITVPDSCGEKGLYTEYYAIKTASGTGRTYGYADTLLTYSQMYSILDTDAAPNIGDTYNWNTATAFNSGAATLYQDVRWMAQAPHGVALGTSIVAGHSGTGAAFGNHYSYVEQLSPANDQSNVYDNPDSSISGYLEALTGYEIQNMAIGGQQTVNLIARFDDDVLALKPQFLIWEGGSNDINGWGATMATIDSVIIARTAQVRDSCRANGIVLVVTLMPARPAWADANDSLRCDTRDSINRKLVAMLTQHEFADSTIIIDLDYVIGSEHPTADNRLGGRAYGNRWDLSVTNDGAHFYGLGYRRWATEIYNAFQRNPRADVN